MSLKMCHVEVQHFLMLFSLFIFLHSGFPIYFTPFFKPRHSVCNIRKCQADGVFLEVPHFATSVHKSTKPYGHSFFFYTPKIWNDLPDDVRSVTSLQSFRKKLKTYLFSQAYTP